MINKYYFNHMKKLGLTIVLILSTFPLLFSQVDSTLNSINLPYRDYVNMVLKNNLEYMAEKYNLDIAEAKIEAARIFQNPTISIDWAGNDEEKPLRGYSLSTEISKTFELGQKRKARINLAKSENAISQALLTDYLQNLQANATLNYLEALKQQYLFEVMRNSYQMMKRLSDADSLRLSLGSIKAIDATQSKIEAGVLLNDLFQFDADRKNSFLNLSTATSTYHADTLFFPVGKFENYERDFKLSKLVMTALNNRPDLLASESNVTYNQNAFTLTRKERITDIDLTVGTSNAYLNEDGFSPTSTEIFAGIEVPLKFSNFNKGELRIAQYQVAQARLSHQQIEIKIQNEVVQAYNQYIAMRQQAGNFNQGLLEQSEKVLKGKVFSYSRGETSLLEVLNAQRTYNDLQIAYFETLYNCYAALVELERAAAFWDIEIK